MPLQSPAGRRHRPRRLLAAAPAKHRKYCLLSHRAVPNKAGDHDGRLELPPGEGRFVCDPPTSRGPPTVHVAETRKFPKKEILRKFVFVSRRSISFGDLIPSDETHWLPNKSVTKLWEVSDETSTVYLVRLRGSISMMAPLRTPPLPYALSSRWAYRS